MKIGVISDTHHHLPSVRKAIQIFREHQVEMVVHGGDWVAPFVPQFINGLKPSLDCPIHSVFGNNDGDVYLMLQMNRSLGWGIEFHKEIFEMAAGGKQISVYHGTESLITDALIRCQKVDAVFTGHTHLALNKKTNDTLHLNPGTTSFIRGTQTLDEATVAIYDTAHNAAEIVRWTRKEVEP
ncbi:MAG TPA: metallophosphoesterase [bacterium]|nr:metallophosphoesterase [bacterium]